MEYDTLVAIIMSIVGCLCCYLIGSFYSMSFEIVTWTEQTRLNVSVVASCWLVSVVLWRVFSPHYNNYS